MKLRVAALFVIFFLAACGGGSSGGGVTEPPPISPTAAEILAADLAGLSLSDFYTESFKALTYRSPEGILWRGLTSVYPLDSVGLDDLSDGYRRDTFAVHQVVLDALRTYDRAVLSAVEQLTFIH